MISAARFIKSPLSAESGGFFKIEKPQDFAEYHRVIRRVGGLEGKMTLHDASSCVIRVGGLEGGSADRGSADRVIAE